MILQDGHGIATLRLEIWRIHVEQTWLRQLLDDGPFVVGEDRSFNHILTVSDGGECSAKRYANNAMARYSSATAATLPVMGHDGVSTM
jgi:hypothetical protein